MARAELSILEELHNLIAKDMLARIKSGECEAKEWAVIVKFLKDNNIDSLATGDADGEDAFAKLVAEAQKRVDAHR